MKKNDILQWIPVGLLLVLIFLGECLYVWFYGNWVGNPMNSHFQNARLIPGGAGLVCLFVSIVAFLRFDIFFGKTVRKVFAEGGRKSYAYGLFWKGMLLIAVQLFMDTFFPFGKFF